MKSKNEMLEKELVNKDLELKQGNKNFDKNAVSIIFFQIKISITIFLKYILRHLNSKMLTH